MRFTVDWLREFVDLGVSPPELAERLTLGGLEVEQCAPLGDGSGDWVLDVAVPPNRGDCLGILGLAREAAALLRGRLKRPASVPAVRVRRGGAIALEVREPRLCPRYSGRVVGAVRVAGSPAWLRERLEAAGFRSINNVVDVTNYVMLETGQPLHAFDLEKLSARRVVVRRARAGERLLTLDGVERELSDEELLICDGERPAALAGIMGGSETEVTALTKAVFLESAHFDPVTVRRSARRLGLRSEASHRFERFVDPEGTVFALERAAYLLAQVAGGVPEKAVLDYRAPRRRRRAPVVFRFERARRLLGAPVDRREAERIFKSLGIAVQRRTKDALELRPPSFRADLAREADFIEEVARIRGYERIPATLPAMRMEAKWDGLLWWQRRVRSVLLGQGLTEAVHLTFTSAPMNRLFRGLWGPEARAIALKNPLTHDSAEMRLSLVGPLAASLRRHLEQRMRSYAVFEFGKVFSYGATGEARERNHLAGLVYGVRPRRGLAKPEERFTFFDLKGIVEEIVAMLGLERVEWQRSSDPEFHPGRSADVLWRDERLGALGEIHPDYQAQLGLPAFFAFELDFDRLLQYARRDFTVRSLPRFPSVERDVAFIVEDALPAQRIVDWIGQKRFPLVDGVRVFDEYRGVQIGEGKKSLAYAISYRAEDRTLTDSEVNEVHRELVEGVVRAFGAQVRA
jgi:phenylalanyl-tRNA synthetase beta chain